ncbi:MAG: hypothetical protein HY841_07055 [Bacteroidetes bacterium]|nr:hypothetical protein [Bacteroidota bacterium]
METKTSNEKKEQAASATDYSSLFILKGKSLQVKINGQPIDNPVPKKFQSEKELEELVKQNGKVLFGENVIVLDGKKIMPEFLESYALPAFLIDIRDAEKPKLYVVEVLHSKQNFGAFCMRMTSIFSLFRNQDNRIQLMNEVESVIDKSKSIRKELGNNENNIVKLLEAIIGRAPDILLIIEGARPELAGFRETYAEWQAVKPIHIKKFSNKGETIITMYPGFAEIQNRKTKSNAVKEKINYTEDYHMEDVAEEVKAVYGKMKAELLKADKTLQFNPQKYYISLRKNRNLAFFHFSQKKISLVVMNPDKATRKVIKHHEVKTLTEKVQKFWNGASCTIVLENTKHLNEVISLLKKLVANA